MGFEYQTQRAGIEGPIAAYGQSDAGNAMLYGANAHTSSSIHYGRIVQFNTGLYSALVADIGSQDKHTCLIGAQNVTPGFGYSDATILREGDEVIYILIDGENDLEGMILARRPVTYSKSPGKLQTINSDTEYERRTHFHSNETYSLKQMPYQKPFKDDYDNSTKNATSSRPTDLVPGEFCTLNQHHCGFIGGMYSMTLSGGRAQIRLSAFENRIRVIADSIVRHTLCGNYSAGHNRRYLSEETTGCLYQEERLGLKSKAIPAFEDLGKNPETYHTQYYFTKNKEKKQTARYRLLEHKGYYGGISSRYVIQPEQGDEIRTMDAEPLDKGVARESIDPMGQYRLATVGMLGFERIGRIPVPFRQKQIWERDTEEPEATKLTAFKHNEDHPYYRQLELADRVAYDLKNSYARYDEDNSGFYTPEEKDLGSVGDKYDQGFTDSETVKAEKYDKRRSGIWQGEDGSIILRDAWGSEIVMIGGNIQLSCAGNIQIMPGKTALTLAGDDIIQKAQNSIDIHAAREDIHIDGHQNVQIMAGTDDDPGGVTIEARGAAGPWEAKESEPTRSTGILLKAAEQGAIVTDTDALILKGKDHVGIVSEKGNVLTNAETVITKSQTILSGNDDAVIGITDSSVFMNGSNASVIGQSSAMLYNGGKIPVPLKWKDTDTPETPPVTLEEEQIARGFTSDKLEKMYFTFRSSEACGTDKSWEIDGGPDFTLFEPFWVQVSTKFETLKGLGTDTFKDCINWAGSNRGRPWPGELATSAKYARISGEHPHNLTDDGLNKSRKEVLDSTSVETPPLQGNYKIRKS